MTKVTTVTGVGLKIPLTLLIFTSFYFHSKLSFSVGINEIREINLILTSLVNL
jgi:hypothetical protein